VQLIGVHEAVRALPGAVTSCVLDGCGFHSAVKLKIIR
jgi:hypothetical protein